MPEVGLSVFTNFPAILEKKPPSTVNKPPISSKAIPMIFSTTLSSKVNSPLIPSAFPTGGFGGTGFVSGFMFGVLFSMLNSS